MTVKRIYDISQEVFGCEVYAGDPSPVRQQLVSMENGDVYNLTAFEMCAHNGTHVDAPRHFLRYGRAIDEIPLEHTVGLATVVECTGAMTARDARRILDTAAERDAEAARRILIKGRATVSAEAAQVFADAKILLIASETQSVGPEYSPLAVHLTLLGAGVALLEGVRLTDVPPGTYLLSAAPLALGGADGAPCRAVLIEI